MEQSTVEHSPSTPPSSYTVHGYTREALPQILVLLQQTLGNSGAVRKTEDFWLWKHHENPFGASYGLYAWDESNAEAASLRVLMRWTFRDRAGTIFHGVRAVDTATHPNHQRHGLFTILTSQAVTELTEQHIDLIFNTPNQKSLPGYLKMGWQIAAEWPLYLRPLRAARMAYRHLRPVVPETATHFPANFGPAILSWNDFVRRFGDQIEKLLSAWECSRIQTGIRTQRSAGYFAWRYGSHPHIQYAVYPHVDEHSRLQGFAILRPNVRYGRQETVLTEMCLAQPDARLGTRLLSGLTRQLRSDYLIAHFADQTLEAELLKHNRFWRLPRKQIVFTVRPLQDTSAYLVQAEAWDLSLGDLELF
jgi:GNAT superfamily N-acetyltransferase